jgi:8-oxo-dGTP pyrophosphatase MutT (NUDIX family)
MKLRKCGRAVVPVKISVDGKPLRAIIITEERNTKKYSLPGGRFDKEEDRDTLDSALREMHEEIGLTGERNGARLLFSYKNHTVTNYIYLVRARGKLKLNEGEIEDISFLSIDNPNIKARKLKGFLRELVQGYLPQVQEYTARSAISVRY